MRAPHEIDTKITVPWFPLIETFEAGELCSDMIRILQVLSFEFKNDPKLQISDLVAIIIQGTDTAIELREKEIETIIALGTELGILKTPQFWN